MKDNFVRFIFSCVLALSLSFSIFAQRQPRTPVAPKSSQQMGAVKKILDTGLEQINNQQYDEAFASFAECVRLGSQSKASPEMSKVLTGCSENKAVAYAEIVRKNLKLGLWQRRENKYDEAIASFNECLRQSATLDGNILAEVTKILNACRISRGYAYVLLGNYDQGVADYKEGYKGSEQSAEYYYMLGDAAVRKKQLTEAISFFTQAVQAAPADPQYLIARGSAHLSLKDETAALADYSRALEINPFVNNAVQFKISASAPDFRELAISAYIRRAGIYEAQKNYKTAIDDYSSMLRLQLDAHQQAFAHYRRAEALRFRGYYGKAIDDYRKTLEIAATDDKLKTDFTYAANIGLGKIHTEIGDKRVAAASYNNALAAKPGDREATEALSKLQTIVEPQTAADFLRRGNENFYEGKGSAAIEDYTRAVELNPKLGAGYFNRGRIYAEMRYAEEDKINAEKNRIRQTRTLGEFLPKSENSSKAIADFTKAIELDPENSDAYRWRGLIYKIDSDYKAAIADFRACLKFEPSDQYIQAELKIAESALMR